MIATAYPNNPWLNVAADPEFSAALSMGAGVAGAGAKLGRCQASQYPSANCVKNSTVWVYAYRYPLAKEPCDVEAELGGSLNRMRLFYSWHVAWPA